MACEKCRRLDQVERAKDFDGEHKMLCLACRDEVREHGQDPIGVDDEFPDPVESDEGTPK